MANSTKPTPIEHFIEIISKLRSPEGCPWDREQTHSSLKEFLIEESAELLDAIDDGDTAEICEELGDLLLHIVFHSQIAMENGEFDFNDVVQTVTAKMIRRHPHVFADEKADNPDEVLTIWKKVKKEEKGDSFTRFERIPRHMPALMRAREYQKKVAKVGFDWSSQSEILDKIIEEVTEVKTAMESGNEQAIDEEIGDLLFAVVNLTRFRKRTSAEELLAKAIQKFQKRFDYIESQLNEKGSTPEESDINEMEKLWNKAKSVVG
jgi:tetrapyrrole methylase family protein/MazG family protein